MYHGRAGRGVSGRVLVGELGWFLVGLWYRWRRNSYPLDTVKALGWVISFWALLMAREIVDKRATTFFDEQNLCYASGKPSGCARKLFVFTLGGHPKTGH